MKQLKSPVAACIAIAVLAGCAWLSPSAPPLAGIARNGLSLHALDEFALKLRHSKHIVATSATIANGRVLLSANDGGGTLALRAEARLDPRRTARVLAALHHHTP